MKEEHILPQRIFGEDNRIEKAILGINNSPHSIPIFSLMRKPPHPPILTEYSSSFVF